MLALCLLLCIQKAQLRKYRWICYLYFCLLVVVFWETEYKNTEN